jgi:hypothetical protein
MALGSSWTLLPRIFSTSPGLHGLSALSPAGPVGAR